MQRIDRLESRTSHPLWLSSHPLDGIKLESEYRFKLAEFIAALKERQIGVITVLLPASEIDLSRGDIDLLAEYRNAGFEIIHFPLENFSTPAGMRPFDELMEQLVLMLEEIDVLVHCRTGCGRTAMVAAGLLIKEGVEAPRAINAVHKARPSSRLTVNQIQYLREYRTFLDSLRP